MANTSDFDFSGLASQLQGLLGQLAPSQDELDRIRKDKALTFGLGLLGVRKGFEMPGIAQSGMNAIAQGRQSMQDLREQKMEGMKLVQYLPMLQQLQDAATQRQVLTQAFANHAQGQQPPMPQGQPQGQPPMPQGQPPMPQGQPPAAAGFGMNDRGAGPQMPPQMPPQMQGQQPPPQMPPQMQGQQPPQQMPPQLGGAPMQGQVTASNREQQALQYRGIGDALSAKGLGDRAQIYYDLAEKILPKLKEQKTLTQNGQRVTVNIYDDGTYKVLPDLSPDQEKLHFADTGGAVAGLDPFTGKPVGGTIAKTQTPDSIAGNQVSLYNARQSNALGYANLAESKRYHNMELGIGADGQPTNVDAVAKAIANYEQPPLGSFTAGKPFGAAIMSKVMDINPTYDAKNYATAQQTMNAFAKGPQGNTVRSIGVAMQHLDVLSQAADALNNGNVPLFNKAANFVETQLGQPAPTNFNAVRDIVGNEIVKAIVGSGGGVGDRDKAQQTVAAANSPAQLNTVINSYKSLFAGQLGGLEQQYKAGTQRDDFASRFLPPQVQDLRKRGASPRPQIVDFSSLPR